MRRSRQHLVIMLHTGITTRFLLQLALGSVLFFAGNFRAIAQTQDPKPSPTPSPEKSEKEEPSEDRIYSVKEVDVKAKVMRFGDDPPSPGIDCPGRIKLLVGVSAVLRKSGKVTEAEVVRESGCSSYDNDAIRVVRKLKFNPALKDNQSVSQYQRFEFLYSRF